MGLVVSGGLGRLPLWSPHPNPSQPLASCLRGDMWQERVGRVGGCGREISQCPPSRVTGYLATCLLLARCPSRSKNPLTRPSPRTSSHPCSHAASMCRVEIPKPRASREPSGWGTRCSRRACGLARGGLENCQGCGGCVLWGGERWEGGKGLSSGWAWEGRWRRRPAAVESSRSWFCCGPVPSEEGRSSPCLSAHEAARRGCGVWRALPERCPAAGCRASMDGGRAGAGVGA